MDLTDKFALTLVRTLKREASEWVDLVERTPEGSITDPYFLAVSRLYRSLDETQKATFLALVQQSNLDGAASVLGFIDGASVMEGWGGNYRLTYDGNNLGDGSLDSFIGAQQDEALKTH